MKRPYKRIVTMMLACVMIAVSVIGATAAHTERMIYVDTLNSTRCTARNSRTQGNTNCGAGLYQILRQLGCSEELCRKVLNQLNSCQRNGDTDSNCSQSDTPQTEPTVPTEKVTSSEAPEQLPEPMPTAEPSGQTAPIPTELPTEQATELPPKPTEATIPPATEAPVPAQAPTETPTEPQQTQAINPYEQEVVRLINEIRTQYGLEQLAVNAELSRVARIKSQDMHDRGYFSHTSPTYGSPFEMMKQFGIRYRTAGENIAMGYRSPQAVVNGWMNSPGHRANILNGSFSEIGMGYVENGNYWTQMFIG